MQTQCPRCQTIFRVTEAHLSAAKGLVRCSQCQHIFDAEKQLLVQSESPPSKSESEEKSEVSDSDILGFKVEEEDFGDSDDSEIPELLKDKKRTSWKSLFFWSILTLVFAALLTGQILWLVQKDLILQHPEVRPWLERFCQHFLCVLPETRDLRKFHMQEHVIHPHPNIEGAMEIQAIFSNRADFPQPYPDVQLTFSDIHGKSLAQRRFKPSEYLYDYNEKKQMHAGASVHIRLEIVDMTENGIESYNFEFF